ncbi:MAG: HD domain-containing protein [Planctomycetes bacterium]|nr:HD domain-containing protein [Planctomycetota bacterium]
MPRKILIVDDEVHIRQVLSIKLRNAGYETFTAEDGRKGLEIARAEHPSLVITDFQMPFMSGLELSAELAEAPETREIPIILLTARGHSLDEGLARTENIREILSKPFSPRAVLELVEGLLGSAGDELEHASVGSSPETLDPSPSPSAGPTPIESLGRQLSETYEEMNLLYTIIQSMTKMQRPERFVQQTCDELLATLSYRWIGTVFAETTTRIKSLAGRSFSTGTPLAANEDLIELGVRLAAETGAPRVLEPATDPDHTQYGGFGHPVLVHPIMCDGESIGVLIAGGKEGEDTSASSVDMKLLGATASTTAIFLENAALYADLNATFLGTVEALTASIDAKDAYTCGHSQRVAQLTQQLAAAAGFDEQFVARTKIAGLVHDVGKIGVPERVLLKPGKLDAEEFGWIRRHPEMGYTILKDIPLLEDVLPGVLHHHERWDGRGYPAGLAGEDIPLLGRLIALADAFDAMSSDRTYRTRLERPQVLAEITAETGTQFDPDFAPIFIGLDFDEYDRLVTEHQLRFSPVASGDAA